MAAPAPARRRRLSRGGDFQRAYRNGSSRSNRFAIVYAFPRGDSAAEPGSTRLGVSVGRRVGNAVVRNRVKRVLREAFWADPVSVPPGYDFAIVARPDAAEAIAGRDPKTLANELRELVAEAAGGRR